MIPLGENGWSEHQRMVMDRLDESRAQLHLIRDDMVKLRVEVAILKTKAAVFGASAGFIAAVGFRMLLVWVS